MNTVVKELGLYAQVFMPGRVRHLYAYKSSPVSDLSKWTAPVLFVHGDDDRNVIFQQTTDLVERLREKNVPVELLVLPDEVHGFLRYESWTKVFNAAKDFFDRKLKN